MLYPESLELEPKGARRGQMHVAAPRSRRESSTKTPKKKKRKPTPGVSAGRIRRGCRTGESPTPLQPPRETRPAPYWQGILRSLHSQDAAHAPRAVRKGLPTLPYQDDAAQSRAARRGWWQRTAVINAQAQPACALQALP